MAGFDPEVLMAEKIEKASKSKIKPPSELDIKREERKQTEAQTKAIKEARLNKPPPPPPPTPEELIDPSVLLDRVHAYRERFPQLKSRNSKLSGKSSIDELLDEIHYIELQLGGNKDGNVGNMIFIGSMMALENSTQLFNPLNLNLNGLGKVAKENINDFSPLIDELMIKHGAGFYMCPEYRLIFSVTALVMTVNAANNGDSRLGDALQKVNNVVNRPPGSDSL
jgi:hypothetical protein